MNLSNPEEESFDAKGIGCGGGRRSKAIGLKEKLAGGLSQGISIGFFKSSNRAMVLACSFH